MVTYLGLARADDSVVAPSGTTSEGLPIYERRVGFLFSLVVEGRPISPLRSVGISAFRWSPFDPAIRPDLEVILSNSIGDGSTAVCDNMLPVIGGVPSAGDFALTQPVSDAINDLGCRFTNGEGLPVARSAFDACTAFADGSFRFVDSSSTVQFCGQIAERFAFPVGDTVVTARLRDNRGNPGPSSP